MARGVHVPITPRVLRWAIDRSGYSDEEIAKIVGVELAELAAWLSGDRQPTITYYRLLANAVKRPPAVLLLPRPPEVNEPVPAFRHPSGTTREHLLPDELRRVREVGRVQSLCASLLEEIGESVPTLPNIAVSSSAETTAAQVRQLLGVSVEQQVGWKNESRAATHWRDELERLGVLMFFLPMGGEASQGFAIWNDRAPAIAVNTHWNVAARVYTMFHELGHLVTRTSSICLDGRHLATGKVEKWCEAFAANVLMPRTAVLEALGPLAQSTGLTDVKIASAIARRFKVSLRAATVRLIHLGVADQQMYAAIPPLSDQKSGGGGGGGRNRAKKRFDEYGRRTAQIMIRGLHDEVITTTDVMRYLGVGFASVEQLKDLAA